jgi:hypothetical protein
MLHQIKGIAKLLLMLASICCLVFLLDPLLTKLGPSFSLFSRRDFGKIAFIAIVLVHFLFLLNHSSKELFTGFLKTSFSFFANKSWLLDFAKTFLLATGIFTLLFATLTLTGFVRLANPLPTWTDKTTISFLVGTIAAFTLAWSEEVIFRAGLYKYFEFHSFKPIPAAFVTSVIFSLSHDMKNPFSLMWPNWQLGLGLFLLGFILNLLFINSRKLASNIGFHAGLVFAGRVIYRSFPFYVFSEPLPWWLNTDLRASALVQVIFALIVGYLLYENNKPLTNRVCNKIN